MYKKDLALKNIQWLIYHKVKPNQTCLSKHLILIFHIYVISRPLYESTDIL